MGLGGHLWLLSAEPCEHNSICQVKIDFMGEAYVKCANEKLID